MAICPVFLPPCRQAAEAERAENNALRTKIATNRQEDEKRELDVVSEMKRLLRAEIKSDDTKELIEEEIGKYLNSKSINMLPNCSLASERVERGE